MSTEFFISVAFYNSQQRLPGILKTGIERTLLSNNGSRSKKGFAVTLTLLLDTN